MRYIDLPMSRARREKWKRGQALYGDVFIGEPAEQFDEEMLDARNYADQMIRDGYPSIPARIASLLCFAAQCIVRAMYRARYR